MRDPNRKVVIMQWFVIAALVIGAGVGVFMLMQKTEEYKTQVQDQQGSVGSLREQLRQAKSSPPPDSDPMPDATGRVPSPTPTASPAPTATPAASPSPTATPSR